MGFIRLSEVGVMKEHVGERLSVVALIKGVDIKPTKLGQDSIVFTMVDKDNERECRGFEVTNGIRERTSNTTGRLFDIEVDVKPYDKSADGVSCILYDIREHRGKYSADEFRNVAVNLQGYISGISGYLSMISDTIYGQIASYVLAKYWDKFIRYPAARSVHHNLIGGLAMHTVCVTNSCISSYNTYASVYGPDVMNYSLLIAAALIHDVGKCNEYTMDDFGTTEYSTHAALSTHIMDGIIEIATAADALGYTGTAEVEELKHCIAAHHGKLEWGSPVKPATLEAMTLHMADLMDSEVWQFNKNYEKISVGESKSEWIGSEVRSYYKGLRREDAITNLSIDTASNEEDV